MEIRIDRNGVQVLLEFHPQAVGRDEVESFVAGLHQMIDAGSVFHAGQTLQHGWSTLRFIALDSDATGYLAFEELDGSGVPDHWTRGVSRTLIARRLQTSVCNSFSLPDGLVDFPSLAQSSITCTELDPEGALLLHRQDPLADHDSGWFFSCQHEHDHDDPTALSNDTLYAHACRIQAVLPFLAMPVGSRVLLAEDGTVQKAYGPGGVPLAVAPGSYLAARRGRTSRV